MATKWLVVDDSYSRIAYEGNWYPTDATNDNNGAFGAPFQNTLHATGEDGSFSFQFSGSAVTVYGTNMVSESGPSQSASPSWECFIDGSSIGANPPSTISLNNWIFCDTSDLTNDSHTLTVQVKVPVNTTFWLDRIQYLPSASADFSQSFTYIDNLDPSVIYDSTWIPLSDIANMTQTTGGSVSLTFNGVSVTWFGFIPNDIPHGSMTGSYTIDGGPPQSFSFFGPDPNITRYNQQYFQTPTQSLGQHTLEVVFGGDDTVLPLSLDYFIIQNSASNPTVNPNQFSGPPISPTASEPQSSVSPYSTTSPAPSMHSSPPSSVKATDSSRAAISPSPVSGKFPDGVSQKMSSATEFKLVIAGAIGGFFLLVLLGALIIYVRRRTRQGSEGDRHDRNTSLEAAIPYTETQAVTFPRKFAPVRRRSSAISPRSLGTFADQMNRVPQIYISSTLVEPTSASKFSVDSYRVPSSSLLSPQHYKRHEDSGLLRVHAPTRDLTSRPPSYTTTY